MRQRRFLMTLAVIASFALGARLAAQPSWQLAGLQGGSLSSADAAEGVTVFVIWAGWSHHCRDVVERANALVGRWGGRARVVLVNFQEDPAEVTAFLEGKAPQAQVFLDPDGSFSKGHQVTKLPGLVVYRDGNVTYKGPLPSDPDAILSESVH